VNFAGVLHKSIRQPVLACAAISRDAWHVKHQEGASSHQGAEDMFRSLGIGLVVAVLAIFSGAPAFAVDAFVTVHLNLRAGPGTGYAVIGVLPPRQIVSVDRCSGASNWCHVSGAGKTGWVSARYLSYLPGEGPGSASPGGIVELPSPNFGGGGNAVPLPGVSPVSDGNICFYDQANYQGRRFCVGPGDAQAQLDFLWDNRFRSAQVSGFVIARVCTDPGFSGQCAVVDRPVADFGQFSARISSFSVTSR
jgi:uncharacterized protein YraI